MNFNNIKELINYQKSEVNKSMEKVNEQINIAYRKKYNIFTILYYKLTMKSRLKRMINKPYIRIDSKF